MSSTEEKALKLLTEYMEATPHGEAGSLELVTPRALYSAFDQGPLKEISTIYGMKVVVDPTCPADKWYLRGH